MNKALVEAWNKSSQTIPDDKQPSAYVKKVESRLTKGCTICDLGAGKGTDSLYFLEKGYKVIAIDISDAGLAALDNAAKKKKLEKQLATIQADLNDLTLPLTENSVDCLYSRLVVHYFTFRDTVAIVKEIYRILKPGGKAYFTVKSSDDEAEMTYLKSAATESEPGVFVDRNNMIKSRFTMTQWKSIINEAGIKNYTVNEYVEDLSSNADKTKSGNTKFILTEIILSK